MLRQVGLNFMMMKPGIIRHGQWYSGYKGNTNFKDNMEELFIKVCEKMDEKPPVTDKDHFTLNMV